MNKLLIAALTASALIAPTAAVAQARGGIVVVDTDRILAECTACRAASATLNSQQNVTVFAPVDSAFQAIPPDQLKALLADVPRLTALLPITSSRAGSHPASSPASTRRWTTTR